MNTLHHDKQLRLAEAVERRWRALPWHESIDADVFAIPESHYRDLSELGLDAAQQVGLNRLFACFTCELFVHFERYVIAYLERYPARVPFLSRAVVERFVEEERAHVAAFCKLLAKLRPDLYEGRRTTWDGELELRFIQWSRAEDVALRFASPGTFFLMAWLFEEITLFMPHAFENETQGSPLVREAMTLHAREEESHVAIDHHVVAHLRDKKRGPRTLADVLSMLPLLAFIDWRVATAWRPLVRLASTELDLTPAQRRAIAQRKPTRSDVLGVRSFLAKVEPLCLPGDAPVLWALNKSVGG